MGVQPIDLGPFIEGVNVSDPISKLSVHELLQSLNLRIGIRGDIEKRPGHDFYGSSPAKVNGDNLVNLVTRFYRADASKKLIAASNGKLKRGDDGTGAWTQIDIDGAGGNTMHVSNLCDTMVYKDRLYITDGTRVQRYPDPTSDNKSVFAGHYIHTAPTLAGTTGGDLDTGAIYKYFVTSVAGDMGEGGKGAEATIDLTVSDNKVQLTDILTAAAKHGETHKNIYRTEGGGSIFKFLVQSPTATNSYDDTAADGTLGAEYVPVHRPPDEARFCIMGHDERAYYFGRTGANKCLVEVSDVGFPDRITDVSGFFTISNNDGDEITGGALVPGGIFYTKKNSCWLHRGFGFPPINISPKGKRGASVGCVAPFTLINTPIGLIFLSHRGEIYLFDGNGLTEIGRKIATEFRGMTQAAMGIAVACYHDYRYILSFDRRGAKGYNWTTWEYDTRIGKWDGPFYNKDFFTPSYYSVWDSVLDKGELYWGEAKAGNGSYVYGRTEFSKTDRGNKFVSTLTNGQIPYGGLGRVNSTKIFVEGLFSSDAQMIASHINELGAKTSVTISIPSAASTTKWNDGHDWAPSANAGKWGDLISQILEGSFMESAGSKIPQFEITDGGTALDMKIKTIKILAEVLPLK